MENRGHIDKRIECLDLSSNKRKNDRRKVCHKKCSCAFFCKLARQNLKHWNIWLDRARSDLNLLFDITFQNTLTIRYVQTNL